ncbi:MAG: hypothetical protein WDM96_08285 [Lacunisphaera sp.]
MTFDLGADTSLAQTLYVRKMGERGLLVSSNYYLMVAHDDAKIAQLLTAADEVLGEITQLITLEKLAEEAGVARSQRGFARLA